METVNSIIGYLWLGMVTFWMGAFIGRRIMDSETKELIKAMQIYIRSSAYAFDGKPTDDFSDFSNVHFTTKVWKVNGQRQPHPLKIESCLLQDIRKQLISANMEHAKTIQLLQELIAFQRQVYGDPDAK